MYCICPRFPILSSSFTRCARGCALETSNLVLYCIATTPLTHIHTPIHTNDVFANNNYNNNLNSNHFTRPDLRHFPINQRLQHQVLRYYHYYLNHIYYYYYYTTHNTIYTRILVFAILFIFFFFFRPLFV